ncbi:MAG: N-acetylmuramoyl-L-alanine amidase, partial [Eubacterium sp.]|nr:N-acetylmuramoyl-L-alanine amidase [Eubacterium sp.]
LIDENGNLVDENGNLVDENGNLVDENGNLIDENGNLVDENGNLIDENGNPIDETAASDAAAASKVIVLDPGHSAAQKGEVVPIGPGSEEMKDGDTSGTAGVASGLAEYDLTMSIAQQLRAELQARGYTVLLTHEDNGTPMNCDERANVANAANADCFIRIHADGSDDPSASGALGICITPGNPWTPDTYSESRRLSDCVLESYCAATGIPSRGVLEEDNMTGNNWATVPTTLLELGFMTNPDEDMRMADAGYQLTMVQGIADGIDRFFGSY